MYLCVIFFHSPVSVFVCVCELHQIILQLKWAHLMKKAPSINEHCLLRVIEQIIL